MGAQVRESDQAASSAQRRRIERFEDLIAWQKARELAKRVYLVTQTGRFARDFGLASQIQRASVSVLSNIAEGFERAHPAEFHQFLAVARGSCAEVRAQLYIAFDIGYIDDRTFTELLSLATEVGRIIGGLRLAVSKKMSGGSSTTRVSRLATRD